MDATTIRSLTDDRDLTRLAAAVRDLGESATIDLIAELPATEAAVVFRLLPKHESVDVFDRLDRGTRSDLIAALGTEELTAIFADLDPEDQSRLVDELPAGVATKLLSAVSRSDLDAVMAIAGYDRNSIARRMSPTAVVAWDADTVAEVAARIRDTDVDLADVRLVPVLAPDRTLLGTLDPLELLRCPPDAPIAEVMDPIEEITHTSDDQETAARAALTGGITVLPVCDSEDRLVGIVPIDDAARIIAEADEADFALSGGTQPLYRRYLPTPIVHLARSRIVWLLVLAVSAVLTVHVLEVFESTLAEVVALALFIPLLTGIGGNTGSQAATTVTRALAMDEVGLRDWFRVAGKELSTGLLLGVLLAVPAFAIASPLYGIEIGAIIALTLIVNCPVAAFVGGSIPIVAKACRVDPAVVSTPFISTFCDASGLLVYFTIAISIMGL
ncbi:magnesium transporter [Brevibacterium casei]|uniref:Magnesium transporter MgtE n=1 Tax=Brevibacterium casei TaxID=33889 RepID=A0A269ZCJ0_9MICO|nr:magnesium transporter [Brevibacterium casei]MCT1551996.1 magnesium transporter [Brevibacterium casei]MCT1560512.1 magnesium transporter [Brevibacterium casei]MCT2184426.1 magnesium transporter [Brevibacterium casei]MCT2208954.1 magnesium transporter [Brevibacterium casei]MDH5147349.1 magnesium transporter [Brevibacterium casei]